MKQVTHKSYRIGEIILEMAKLQFFWILYTLKGGILLGFFPSTMIVMSYFLNKFNGQEPIYHLAPWFKKQFHLQLKQANKLGWTVIFLFTVLRLDLFISREWIHVTAIHFFLTALLFLLLGTSIYLFPSFLRYQLSFLQYFKQAFFLFLCSIPETIAIFVAIFLLTLVNVLLPILVVIALVPLFLLPITWFCYRSMKKIESNQYDEK